MATDYYGVNSGQHDTDVKAQTSTTGTDLIVTVNNSNILTKAKLLELLEYIKIAIIRNKYPL
jgi:hypothetical protein